MGGVWAIQEVVLLQAPPFQEAKQQEDEVIITTKRNKSLLAQLNVTDMCKDSPFGR